MKSVSHFFTCLTLIFVTKSFSHTQQTVRTTRKNEAIPQSRNRKIAVKWG